MAVRSISVKLAAEVSNYVQGFGRAKAATGDLIGELSKSEQQRQNWQQMSTGMVIAGAGIAAGLGLATKAAIDWESAWAGVLKTVDGSDAQLGVLEEELRALARTLPQSHEEIAGVAEAAGQLGVATEDVSDFTATMLDLGVATNLTAQDAATQIARMANIMGTATSDVDRLGSALVDLGNNSATTEAEILEMAQRISGAGTTIGISETDVLGFATALSSVGVRAQAGGSAISRAMISIEGSVREGGKSLDTLAETAGMTADGFRQAYQDDAAGAITTFITGLGRMEESGEDVFAVLDELGFAEIRLRDALLRLSASGDLLTDSLDRGADAWDENLALTEEAERRYGTAEARLEIARNQLNDFAIEMGEMFVPAVASGADALGGFVEFLGSMPEPLQGLIGGLGAVTAALLLVGGTAGLGLVQVAKYRQAMTDLGMASGTTATASTRVARGLRTTMLWAGRAAGAFAAMQIAGAAASAAFGEDFTPKMDALTEGIARFGRTGEVHGEAVRVLGEDFTDLSQALRTLGPEGVGPNIGNAIKGATEWAFQLDDVQGSLGRSKEQVDAYDQALASLVKSGRQDEAAAAFERLAGLAEEQGVSVERLKALLPGYAAALETADEQGGETADGMDQIASSAEQAAEEVEQLKEAFDLLFGIQMDVDRANLQYRQGLADLVEELEDGNRTLELNTQAGRDNRGAVLDQVDAINDVREANVEAGMSIDDANEKYEKQLDKLEDLLVDRGFEKDAVRDIIDAYRDIPEQVTTTVEARGLAGALSAAQELQNELAVLHGTTASSTVHVDVIRAGGAHVAQRHGGIVAAAQGMVTSSPTVLFGERETGQEAFIPRDGITSRRGLSLADQAARWHGGRVVAGDGASLGGRHQWHGQRQPGGMTAGAGVRPDVSTTYNVYPQRADFTVHDLDALQRRQEARARVGRPH